MTVKEYLNQAYLLYQRIHSHTIECQAGDCWGSGRCSGTVYYNFRGETPQKA